MKKLIMDDIKGMLPEERHAALHKYHMYLNEQRMKDYDELMKEIKEGKNGTTTKRDKKI